MTADFFAVRIAGHRADIGIAAPYWPIGKYLRFRPVPDDAIGPAIATYEAVDVRHASFCTLREARAIKAWMKGQYPFVYCEVRRFVEAADVVA